MRRQPGHCLRAAAGIDDFRARMRPATPPIAPPSPYVRSDFAAPPCRQSELIYDRHTANLTGWIG